MLFSELSHLLRLMRGDLEIEARLSCAQQHEACFSILWEISERIRLVDTSAILNPSRAG